MFGIIAVSLGMYLPSSYSSSDIDPCGIPSGVIGLHLHSTSYLVALSMIVIEIIPHRLRDDSP